MKVLSIVSTITKANLPVRKVQQVRNIARNLEATKGSAITSAMKSYYRDVEEKLNDILLDRKRQHLSTTVVEHNIDAYNKLPAWLQKTLRPSDVSRNGHMDQDYIKELWDAGKEAHRYGVAGRCPVFRGEAENELAENSLDLLSEGISSGILDTGATDVLATLDDISTAATNITGLEDLGNIANVGDVAVAADVADIVDVTDVIDVVDVAEAKSVIADVIDIIQDAL